MSTYFWKKEEGKEPEVSWKFLEKNIPDFNPITGICKLCTREKHQIVFNPISDNQACNTPGTRVGPGGRDRMLAVKNRKLAAIIFVLNKRKD